MQNPPADQLWLARFIAESGWTNLSEVIAVLAWAWVASLLTRDALSIASAPIEQRLPWFLFAISAGIVTDRVDRRRQILAADTVRVLAFARAAAIMWLAALLPPGMSISGQAPRLAGPLLGRQGALMRPFWLAAGIMAVVSAFARRKLDAGLAQRG